MPEAAGAERGSSWGAGVGNEPQGKGPEHTHRFHQFWNAEEALPELDSEVDKGLHAGSANP